MDVFGNKAMCKLINFHFIIDFNNVRKVNISIKSNLLVKYLIKLLHLITRRNYSFIIFRANVLYFFYITQSLFLLKITNQSILLIQCIKKEYFILLIKVLL